MNDMEFVKSVDKTVRMNSDFVIYRKNIGIKFRKDSLCWPIPIFFPYQHFMENNKNENKICANYK